MKVRNQYLLIMAVTWGPCLALTIGFCTVFLRPKLQHRQDLEAKVVQAREQYARAFEAARGEGQARLMKEIEQLRSRTGDFIVAIERGPDLAFEISELANMMRLDSFTMKPGSRRGLEVLSDQTRVGEKRVSMNFHSAFPRFAAFLNALERHHPVLFVESFSINRPMDGSSEPQVEMEMAALVERPPGE